MNITMKCSLNGKEYVFSTNNRMSVVSCRCITNGRRITSDKTLTAVLSACIEVAHAEALDDARCMRIDADLSAGRPVCEETGIDLREWSGESIAADHAEARTMNRYVGNADLLPDSGLCQADRDYLLAVNARLHPDLLAFDIQEAHAKALAMNSELDKEYSRINAMVPDEESKPRFYTVASHFIVGCPKNLPAIE